MATSITFNGVNLQTANTITSNIAHESYDNRDLQLSPLGIRDGSKLVRERRAGKTITVSGHLSYDTKSAMETAIDAFKENMNQQEKNLDIEWAGGTRRFVATLRSLELPREHFNINFIRFSMEFEIPTGYGLATSASSDSTTGAISTVERTINIDGTLAPKPTITLTVNSETTLVQFKVSNVTTGREITIDKDFDTDTVSINLDTNEVLVNGITQEYSGVFPEFQLNNNTYKIAPSAAAIDYDVSVNYTPRYL